MNSITVRNAPEPVVPELLEEAIRAYLRPAREGRSAVEEFQGAVAQIPPQRAQRVAALADAYEMHLAPTITREALTAWLEPLCTAVGGHPPSGDVFDGRIEGVLTGGPDLPLACLSDRSLAAALRAFRWWPSVQELIELLERQAGLLRSRQRALKAVHDLMVPQAPAVVPPVKREGPTEAAIAAVGAMVSGFTAEIRGRGGDAGAETAVKPPVKSGALPPAILAATLRRDIAGGPADLVGGLRKRLEILERQHPEVRE
jgi:hypothetical protein